MGKSSRRVSFQNPKNPRSLQGILMPHPHLKNYICKLHMNIWAQHLAEQQTPIYRN